MVVDDVHRDRRQCRTCALSVDSRSNLYVLTITSTAARIRRLADTYPARV
jgi:hypothetical protein